MDLFNEPYPEENVGRNSLHHAVYKKGLTFTGGKSCTGGNRFGRGILRNSPWPHNDVYIEPFIGGGSVFVNRLPVKDEKINDIDGKLVNFYRVVKLNFDEFERKLGAVLYSEEEFNNAVKILGNRDVCKIDRAVAYFVVVSQSVPYPGNRNMWHLDYNKRPAPRMWNGRVECVYQIADRLKNATITQRDGLDIVSQYSKYENVDMYLDPPYYSSKKDYYNQGNVDKEALADVLSSAKCRVQISGFNGEWDALGWRKISSSSSNKTFTRDYVDELWMNYPYEESYEYFFTKEEADRLF